MAAGTYSDADTEGMLRVAAGALGRLLVPVTHDATSDAVNATIAALLQPAVAVWCEAIDTRGQHSADSRRLRGAAPSMVLAGLAHLVWATPQHLAARIAQRLSQLEECDSAYSNPGPSLELTALTEAALAALSVDSALLCRRSDSEPPTARQHVICWLLLECRYQAAVLQAAAQQAASKAEQDMTALEFSAAKAHRRLDLSAAPHAFVSELHQLLTSWLAVAYRLVRALTASSLHGDVLHRALLATSALVELVHVRVHNAAVMLCTPAELVSARLGRAAALVQALSTCWTAARSESGAAAVPEAECARLELSLATAGKALGLEAASPLARAARALLPVPARPRKQVDDTYALRQLLEGWALQDSLQHGVVERLPLQLRHALAPHIGARGDNQALSVVIARVLSNVPLRRKLVHALALHVAEGLCSSGVHSDSVDVTEAAGRLVLEALDGAVSQGTADMQHSLPFASGPSVVARSAPGEVATQCALDIAQHVSVVTGPAISAALAAASSAHAAAVSGLTPALPIADVAVALQRGAAAAAGAASRPADEAAQLQVLAWSVQQTGEVPATALCLAWLRWHACQSRPVPRGPTSAYAELLPGSLQRAVQSSMREDMQHDQTWAMHSVTGALAMARVLTASSMTLSQVPTHRAVLAQCVHALLARHAAATPVATPPLLHEVTLLSALAAQTLAAFASVCGEAAAAAAAAFARVSTAADRYSACADAGALADAASHCRTASHALDASLAAPRAPPALTHLLRELADLVGVASDGVRATAAGVEWRPAPSLLAAAGSCWAQLGGLRATLLLPPRTLDPVVEAAEGVALLRRDVSHFARPAIDAATLAAALPLQPPADIVRSALLARVRECGTQADAIDCKITPRCSPEAYSTVAARVHNFVHTLVAPAVEHSALGALAACAAGDGSTCMRGHSAVAVARNRASAIAAWCADSAQPGSEYADVVAPVGMAACEVRRGLSLMCTAAELAGTASAYASAGVSLAEHAASALTYPPSMSRAPPGPVHSMAGVRVLAQRATRAISGDAEDDASERTSRHLAQRSVMDELRRCAATAVSHASAENLDATLAALAAVARAIAAAQEAARREEAKADALFKERSERCETLSVVLQGHAFGRCERCSHDDHVVCAGL